MKSLAQRSLRKGRESFPTLRGSKAAKQTTEAPALSYRALPQDEQNKLDVAPAASPRSDWNLRLDTTWLERVNAYNAAYSNKSFHTRDVHLPE